jgi:hypothetical protein
MKDIFDDAPKVAPSVGNVAGLHDLEEEEEDDYLAWNYPQAVGLRTTTRDWTPDGGDAEVEIENPWDGYDAPRWERPTKVNIKGGEEWICPQHGSTCNPGICKARARVEAMRRWAKEHEERQEAKRKRQEKWRKAAEKKERKLAEAEGREVSHDLPPHFPSHRYRGAGGISSDSDDNGSGAFMGIGRTNQHLAWLTSHRFTRWLRESVTSIFSARRRRRRRRLGRRKVLVGRQGQCLSKGQFPQ